jgi:hypothetical protein
MSHLRVEYPRKGYTSLEGFRVEMWFYIHILVLMQAHYIRGELPIDVRCFRSTRRARRRIDRIYTLSEHQPLSCCKQE